MDDAEAKVALERLIRLANSYERAATRGKSVVPIAVDLNANEYRGVADILHRLAATIQAGSA